jgi:4-hydroxythreonine-4-phosphate dehydrogenase
MGEPSGIGPDITLAAWQGRIEADVPAFCLLADPALLEERARLLGLQVPVEVVDRPEDADGIFQRALPVLPLQAPVSARPGHPSSANAPAVLEAIERAVGFSRDHRTAGIVTNPIQKATLYEAGFVHPGHTEMLEAMAGDGAHAVMMLAVPGLRVVPVTVHSPLASVAGKLSIDLIVRTGKALAQALEKDFAISEPRLAVAGLNPHAGEGGALGREEMEIIGPAVEALRASGIEAAGPFPADTLFHDEARARYDAALCMYHDQALIPLKTINFHEGVNVTLGLPFVRTSPDHGTALDIAGTGTADCRSLVAALRLARQIARSRLEAEGASA